MWMTQNPSDLTTNPAQPKQRSAMSEKRSNGFRPQLIRLYGLLAAINAGAWIWAIVAFSAKPVLLGIAFLAYTFGLRHAVDADHIAAIDNVTRKLMQECKRPLTVGFFFSLGHSTIVLVLSLIVYMTASAFQNQLDSVKDIGGVIGTSISVFFLLVIALANIVILRGVWRSFQEVRKGGRYADREQLNLVSRERITASKISS
jgi:nickel/cobalt transporter (NiCoT) family protein